METRRQSFADAAGYKKLHSDIKQITTHLALCAYDLETELYHMLEGGYANWYKDGRTVIASALKSRGKLSYEQGKLIIQLEAQGSPVRTRVINHLIAQLNQTPSHYPGTDLEIELRPTPATEMKLPSAQRRPSDRGMKPEKPPIALKKLIMTEIRPALPPSKNAFI